MSADTRTLVRRPARKDCATKWLVPLAGGRNSSRSAVGPSDTARGGCACLPTSSVLVDRHRCGLSVSLAAPLTDGLASGFHRQPCHPSTLHLSLRVSPPVPQLSLCARPSSLQAQPPPMSLCTVLFFSSNLLQTKHGRAGPASRLPSAGGRGSAVQLSLLARRHRSMTPMPPAP